MCGRSICQLPELANITELQEFCAATAERPGLPSFIITVIQVTLTSKLYVLDVSYTTQNYTVGLLFFSLVKPGF